MTYQEAKDKADAYTEGSAKEALVYKAKEGYAWCTAWQKRNGPLKNKRLHLVYSTFDGKYDD